MLVIVLHSGAYAGFLRGGPNFKFFVILDVHAAKLGGFGGMPPNKKILKNGTTLCVLRQFSTTFMLKNPLKKL